MKKSLLPLIMFTSFTLLGFATNNEVRITNAESISNVELENTNQFKYMNVGDTLTTYTGKGVKIAVIDTGINASHEDFYDSEGNCIISNKSAYFSSSDSSTTKRPHTMNFGTTNGKNDVSSYENLLKGLSDYSGGHGTHVASLISSQINGVGSVGIAPDAELIFIKCANEKGVFPSRNWINGAIEYAIEVGADIINLSIQSYAVSNIKYGSSTSGTGYTDAPSVYASSIKKAWVNGIIIVSAAGNYNTEYASYPANNDNVICVGALANESYDTKAAYSNYGNGGTKADANGNQVACGNIDLVAPGGGYGANAKSNNSYSNSSWGGTSFASPLVAGAIALYKEAHPEATQKNIIKALYDSCYALSNENYFGNGRLDVTRFISTKITELNYVNAIKAIDDFKNSFKTVRENLTDFTNITDAYNNADAIYKTLGDEDKIKVTNYGYLDAGLNVYMFLDDFYYKEVRIKDSNNELSICNYIANKDNQTVFNEQYEMYITSELEEELLSYTFDVTGSDGSIVYVGDTIAYIQNAFNNVQSNNEDNHVGTITTINSNYGTIIIALSIFMLSIIGYVVIKRRQNIR